MDSRPITHVMGAGVGSVTHTPPRIGKPASEIKNAQSTALRILDKLDMGFDNVLSEVLSVESPPPDMKSRPDARETSRTRGASATKDVDAVFTTIDNVHLFADENDSGGATTDRMAAVQRELRSVRRAAHEDAKRMANTHAIMKAREDKVARREANNDRREKALNEALQTLRTSVRQADERRDAYAAKLKTLGDVKTYEEKSRARIAEHVQQFASQITQEREELAEERRAWLLQVQAEEKRKDKLRYDKRVLAKKMHDVEEHAKALEEKETELNLLRAANGKFHEKLEEHQARLEAREGQLDARETEVEQVKASLHDDWTWVEEKMHALADDENKLKEHYTLLAEHENYLATLEDDVRERAKAEVDAHEKALVESEGDLSLRWAKLHEEEQRQADTARTLADERKTLDAEKVQMEKDKIAAAVDVVAREKAVSKREEDLKKSAEEAAARDVEAESRRAEDAKAIKTEWDALKQERADANSRAESLAESEKGIADLQASCRSESARLEKQALELQHVRKELAQYESALNSRMKDLSDSWLILKASEDDDVIELGDEAAPSPRHNTALPQPLRKEDSASRAFDTSTEAAPASSSPPLGNMLNADHHELSVVELVKKRSVLVAREGMLQRWAATLQREADRQHKMEQHLIALRASDAKEREDAQRKLDSERAQLDEQKRECSESHRREQETMADRDEELREREKMADKLDKEIDVRALEIQDATDRLFSRNSRQEETIRVAREALKREADNIKDAQKRIDVEKATLADDKAALASDKRAFTREKADFESDRTLWEEDRKALEERRVEEEMTLMTLSDTISEEQNKLDVQKRALDRVQLDIAEREKKLGEAGASTSSRAAATDDAGGPFAFRETAVADKIELEELRQEVLSATAAAHDEISRAEAKRESVRAEAARVQLAWEKLNEERAFMERDRDRRRLISSIELEKGALIAAESVQAAGSIAAIVPPTPMSPRLIDELQVRDPEMEDIIGLEDERRALRDEAELLNSEKKKLKDERDVFLEDRANWERDRKHAEMMTSKSEVEQEAARVATLSRTVQEAGRILQAHAAEEVGDLLMRQKNIEELERKLLETASGVAESSGGGQTQLDGSVIREIEDLAVEVESVSPTISPRSPDDGIPMDVRIQSALKKLRDELEVGKQFE